MYFTAWSTCMLERKQFTLTRPSLLRDPEDGKTVGYLRLQLRAIMWETGKQTDRHVKRLNGWRWMAFSITVATRRRIKLSKAMREATCRRGKTFDRWSRCGGRDGAGRVYNTGEVRKWTILVEFWQGTSSRYPLFERIAGTKQLFSIFTLPQLLLLLGLPRGVLLLGLCHEWD